MPRAAKLSSPSPPPVDEHILADGARFEILDGKVFDVPPSQEPHAERNSKLAALLEAHAAADFNATVDMLTRTGHLSEFAPDASVYPRERDPQTGAVGSSGWPSRSSAARPWATPPPRRRC